MDSLLECGSLWHLFLDQELPWDLEALGDFSGGNGSPGCAEIPAVSVPKQSCVHPAEPLLGQALAPAELGCTEPKAQPAGTAIPSPHSIPILPACS